VRQAEADNKTAMTFTVKAVREYDRGTTNGREWVKFLVITQEGEIIGTFAPEWQMFVGATVTVPIKETMVKGKLYKSVERPPANVAADSYRADHPDDAAACADRDGRDGGASAASGWRHAGDAGKARAH
jgi:hypothetical protein